ncbi:MAG: 50S ribosomal protein L2 [Candidatus Altiarchaeales archaeon]|nr:50S ribosomal protein L2 [Candidatus Altiarchaeales archaeon]
MGKRIITQRRGRGSPRYKSPSHRYQGEVKYPNLDEGKTVTGQVIAFVDDAGRTAPLAEVLLEDFRKIKMIAPQGVKKGDLIKLGSGGRSQTGDVMPLGRITEGSNVFNIEARPRDGGKLVRASGSQAYVVGHERSTNRTQIKLPSKKMVFIDSNSLATVGKAAGSGRRDKPMVRAGQGFHRRKARGKMYPKVKGRAMNAVDHPHGGGRHPHVGRPTTIKRGTSPGRKVGHIAAKRTGLKKR